MLGLFSHPFCTHISKTRIHLTLGKSYVVLNNGVSEQRLFRYYGNTLNNVDSLNGVDLQFSYRIWMGRICFQVLPNEASHSICCIPKTIWKNLPK